MHTAALLIGIKIRINSRSPSIGKEKREREERERRKKERKERRREREERTKKRKAQIFSV